jgi:quercetin dioxygenase-like cupin family protein
MIIVNTSDAKPAETRDEMVDRGPVYRALLVDPKTTGGFGVALVRFAPGAKLKFHTHTSEQLLYVTEGKGIVATQKEEYTVTPGSVVIIPAGEVHWHGATKDTSFTHVAWYKGQSQVV